MPCSPSTSTTVFVKAAVTAYVAPVASARLSARHVRRGAARESTIAASAIALQIAKTIAHCQIGACDDPPCGAPTVTNTAIPSVSAIAAVHSRRPGFPTPPIADSGSANSRPLTRSGWTTTMDPTESAAASRR